MIDDESGDQYSSGYAWPAYAIPTLRGLLPGEPLPTEDELRVLLINATAKNPEDVQRLYYGYMHFLAGTIVRRTGNSWRPVGFFLRILSAYVLDALVRHDAVTDGPLERFLALQVACGFTNAREAWRTRKPPTIQEQIERTEIRLRIGSHYPDDALVDEFYQRTHLAPTQIRRGLMLMAQTFEPFDGEPSADDADEEWLPGTSSVPDDPILFHPDDPEPIWAPDTDQTEIAGAALDPERLPGNFTSPHTAAEARLLQRRVRAVLATLTPREEKVLRLRFGLSGGLPMTFEEVGQEFEVTRERIRQIEAKALRKLRHPSRAQGLRPFVDGDAPDWNPYGHVLPPPGHEFDIEPWDSRRVRFACRMTKETALAFYQAFTTGHLSGPSDPLVATLQRIGLVRVECGTDGVVWVRLNTRRLSYFRIVIDPEAETLSDSDIAYPLAQGRWDRLRTPLVDTWKDMLRYYGLISYDY